MRKRRMLVPLLMLVGLLAVPAASQAYLTGIADENATMFVNPLYQRLISKQPSSQRISRYIAPYDAADGSRKNLPYLNNFINWYNHARADHVQALVSFYHSESSPLRMPSLATYKRDIRAFIKKFPGVRAYQPWNEENRGNVAHMLVSPSASQAAQYYLTLKSACPHCTIAGLDVLDAQNIRPTIAYIHAFQRDVLSAHARLPTLWGLHNYSDTNRFSSSRTRAVLAAVRGQVWLTETGGVVQLGSSFPNHHGSGLTRAARALTFMFKLAASNPRITRLYIFQWTGSSASARFDAGLTTPSGQARPGYYVVCAQLLRKSPACRAPAPKSTTTTKAGLRRSVSAARPTLRSRAHLLPSRSLH